MRDLTPEELKLAPEWATDYSIEVDDSVVYASENLCWWEGLSGPMQNHVFKGDEIRSIKPFDITKHEFSDAAKDCHILFNNPSWAGGDLQIEIPDVNGNHADAVLIKEHAIAIAKHFKLTGEDLK